jgi:hypothetical protein
MLEVPNVRYVAIGRDPRAGGAEAARGKRVYFGGMTQIERRRLQVEAASALEVGAAATARQAVGRDDAHG